MKREIYSSKKIYNEIVQTLDINNRAFIYFPTGIGKSNLIISLADYYSKNQSVIIACEQTSIIGQYCDKIKSLSNKENILVVSTDRLYTGFAGEKCVIIIDNLINTNNVKLDIIANNNCLICFSSLLSSSNLINFDIIIKYDYSNEASANELFVQSLLEYIGFSDILLDEKLVRNSIALRPDIIAYKDNNPYIFEIKYYRDISVSIANIERAVQQIIKYTKYLDKNVIAVLIVFCDIEESYIRDVFEKYNIILLDIKNILFLCETNNELLEQLQHILTVPINKMLSREPIVQFKTFHYAIEKESDYSKELVKRINNCKFGKDDNASKEYEDICYDSLLYLFKDNFISHIKQNSTKDKMFRMDLLCSIKGGAAFWDFLEKFYKTKFVVFESKNYKDKIDQNLIYITEKYLFTPALRNVAIIISRKGFDENALNAAEGILKEHNKLIVGITDDDLIKMIKMKRDGEEPSDYLYNKVESFLMNISK